MTPASAVYPSEPGYAQRLAGCRILLDCRWLGMGGAGRLTELLLREFGRDRPPGRWLLWGPPERLEALAFDGSEIRASAHDPRHLFGQRDALGVPNADVAVYMHQIRPLRHSPSVTFILDTIPLRHGGTLPTRTAKRAFFRAVARASTRVVTISEFSKGCIVRDLGLSPNQVAIVRVPIDLERARTIAERRKNAEREQVLLYVGRFAPHKNLPRLALAFSGSRFAAAGGRLVLVGGWHGEIERLRAWLDDRALSLVQTRPACSDAELVELMAGCRAVVVPSLEEGYGLPAFEAAAAGIPVAASVTGAMSELPSDAAVLFDPLNIEAIRSAIDEATTRPGGRRYERPDSAYGAGVVTAVASAVAEATSR